MNGRSLEPQHGYPLRLVVPGWYGMASVKWLTSIEAIPRPFTGFQNAVAYRYQRDGSDPGDPVTRIRVKSLMAPPGIAEFVTARRIVDRGLLTLEGRAWSGDGPIVAVEVGVDGARSPARIGSRTGDHAWTAWSFEWHAEPGTHELRCRASDASGASQPLEQSWNHQGMGNNMAQRVIVTVR
jgi:DMSO/TMAO reductase YedYZ molybdopterin-dependent catalytic subunit